MFQSRDPHQVKALRQWTRRQWWRLAHFLIYAARVLMTPARGVAVSMGYRKFIASTLTKPAREPTRSDIYHMRKEELLEMCRKMDLHVTGAETNATLRESLRTAMPVTETRSTRGTPRARHAAGFSKLRKNELIAFCEEVGISTEGTMDALKLRVKAWAALTGDVPDGATSASYLHGQRSSSSACSGAPASAAPSEPVKLPTARAKPTPARPPTSSAPSAAQPSALRKLSEDMMRDTTKRKGTSVVSSSTSLADVGNHLEDRPRCPAGHGQMVVRLNRSTKTVFWGCSQYANGCRVTMPIDDDDLQKELRDEAFKQTRVPPTPPRTRKATSPGRSPSSSPASTPRARRPVIHRSTNPTAASSRGPQVDLTADPTTILEEEISDIDSVGDMNESQVRVRLGKWFRGQKDPKLDTYMKKQMAEDKKEDQKADKTADKRSCSPTSRVSTSSSDPDQKLIDEMQGWSQV
jgi:ssDNA-binding Zn-finger/Zn-ribbon topoisomerase 1